MQLLEHLHASKLHCTIDLRGVQQLSQPPMFRHVRTSEATEHDDTLQRWTHMWQDDHLHCPWTMNVVATEQGWITCMQRVPASWARGQRKKSHLNHVGGIADLAAPMHALGFARGASTQPGGCNGLRREPCERKIGFYARTSIGMAASSIDHGDYMGCLVLFTGSSAESGG